MSDNKENSVNEANKQSLKDDIKKGNIIPFIGAGVSRSVKDKNGNTPFKSWQGLLQDLSSVVSNKEDLNAITTLLSLDIKYIDFLRVADMIKEYSYTNDYHDRLNEVITTDWSGNLI